MVRVFLVCIITYMGWNTMSVWNWKTVWYNSSDSIQPCSPFECKIMALESMKVVVNEKINRLNLSMEKKHWWIIDGTYTVATCKIIPGNIDKLVSLQKFCNELYHRNRPILMTWLTFQVYKEHGIACLMCSWYEGFC